MDREAWWAIVCGVTVRCKRAYPQLLCKALVLTELSLKHNSSVLFFFFTNKQKATHTQRTCLDDQHILTVLKELLFLLVKRYF